MPSADQHRKKAESNRRFFSTISIEDFPDWVVVAAFYTAVHLVEQLRASVGEGHSTNHEDRLAYVQHQHVKIHTAYYILQNASMLARYEANSAFYAQFQPENITERLVEKYLAEVEHYVQTRTSKRSKLSS